jgi:hypothetical protein
MPSLNNWWGSRPGQENSTKEVGKKTDPHSCLNSSTCAIGYACIGGKCEKKESPSTGGFSIPPIPVPGPVPGSSPPRDCGGPGSGLNGGCVSPNPTNPGNPGCTIPTCGQNWPRPDYGPDTDCCGIRTCRYVNGTVQCSCGNTDTSPGAGVGSSPGPRPCNQWCDQYYKSTGETSKACRGAVCDECTSCNYNGVCTNTGGGPCHCNGASACGPGYECRQDGECGRKPFIACCDHTETCVCGEKVTKRYCNYMTEEGGSRGICAGAAKIALRECAKICDPGGVGDDGCTGASSGDGFICVDGGSCGSAPPCPQGTECTLTGCVTASGRTCYFYKYTNYTGATPECCSVECHCHTDCPPGHHCDNGNCISN